MQPLKTLKPFELILPSLSGNSPQSYKCYRFICRKCCDWTIFLQVSGPGLSVCTVILHFYFHYVFNTVIESKFLGFIEKIRGLRRYI